MKTWLIETTTVRVKSEGHLDKPIEVKLPDGAVPIKIHTIIGDKRDTIWVTHARPKP